MPLMRKFIGARNLWHAWNLFTCVRSPSPTVGTCRLGYLQRHTGWPPGRHVYRTGASPALQRYPASNTRSTRMLHWSGKLPVEACTGRQMGQRSSSIPTKRRKGFGVAATRRRVATRNCGHRWFGGEQQPLHQGAPPLFRGRRTVQRPAARLALDLGGSNHTNRSARRLIDVVAVQTIMFRKLY
jgi:hypothetical protein